MTTILDEEDLQNIEAMIEKGEALRPELVRAESAGIPVTDKTAQLDESLRKLRAIKGAFFPQS